MPRQVYQHTVYRRRSQQGRERLHRPMCSQIFRGKQKGRGTATECWRECKWGYRCIWFVETPCYKPHCLCSIALSMQNPFLHSGRHAVGRGQYTHSYNPNIPLINAIRVAGITGKSSVTSGQGSTLPSSWSACSANAPRVWSVPWICISGVMPSQTENATYAGALVVTSCSKTTR